jgi:hypothetical protein
MLPYEILLYTGVVSLYHKDNHRLVSRYPDVRVAPKDALSVQQSLMEATGLRPYLHFDKYRLRVAAGAIYYESLDRDKAYHTAHAEGAAGEAQAQIHAALLRDGVIKE